jgi:hypothetical protein
METALFMSECETITVEAGTADAHARLVRKALTMILLFHFV